MRWKRLKLSEILKQPERDLNKLNEKEKRDLAMKGIEDLIECKKDIDKKEFEEMFGDGIKLNLGCGNKKMEGFINIDSRESVKPDIVWDLEKGLPITSTEQLPIDSVTGVYASHIFEHIKNFIPLMEDIYRVCKNGAKVYAIVPIYTSTHAFSDPTHVRYFGDYTFQYFSKGKFKEMNIDKFDYDFNCDFRIISQSINDGIMTVIMEVVKCQKRKKKMKE